MTGDTGRFVSGTVLAGRYRIVGLIGKGGMGEVYKADDLELEQTVALKFLPEELSKNEELLRRFRSEVRNARQVSHRNVCRVFDIGETEGLYYITMEYIDGDDLSMLLKRIGRLPSDKAVEVSREICMGLAAIHKAGILHRDLKPANIIIDSNGEARITDFGVAGLEADVQGVEARIGTPAYMSPEQADGKELTKQSDIYSLGLLLYEIFTGKQAYEGDSVHELRIKHATTTPTNPSEIVTGIDPLVERVIKRCLEKDPMDRPNSALRVAMSLPGGDPLQIALEAGETPTPEMVAGAPKKGVLKPRAALALFSAFVALFALTLYFMSNYTDAALSPIYKSAEVLRQDAQSVLEQVGYPTSNKNWISDFEVDNGYDFYVTSTGTANTLERHRTGQPPAVYFWYRQSSDSLIPIAGDEVLEDDPPRTQPGSQYVKLDPKGRLVELFAAPELAVPDTPDSTQPDWALVFSLAGLELSKFKESTSQWTPPVYADNRLAWEGYYSEHSDFPIRIEAASYRGNPVYLRIIPPWEEIQAVDPLASSYDAVGMYIVIAVVLLILIGAVYLSIRNLRAGRVDLSGASRVCVYIFLATLLFGLFKADHMASIEGEIKVLGWSLAGAILITATFLVLSVGVEPLVRRWWPDLLISWNRLIAGRFTDPIVGRDVLIGLIVGLTGVNAYFLAGLVRDYLYGKELTRWVTNGIFALNGQSEFVAWLLGAAIFPIFAAFGVLTLLLVFYLLFRRKLVGVTVLAVVWALFYSLPYIFNRGVVAFLVQAVVVAGSVFVYARFGLLTITVSTVVLYLSGGAVTFDPARPYFAQSLVTVAIILALAAYGFYVSLGEQKLFSGRSIDELTG
jgi:serine/threonine-protein kinase